MTLTPEELVAIEAAMAGRATTLFEEGGSRSDEEIDIDDQPSTVKTADGGKWFIVYRTDDGTPVRVPQSNLGRQMLKMREDERTGEMVPAFQYSKPNIEKAPRANLKCKLHPDDPNRSLYDTWGLRVCRREGIPNEAELDLHMRFTHRNAALTIERHEVRSRLDLEREERKQQNENMNRLLEMLVADRAKEKGDA